MLTWNNVYEISIEDLKKELKTNFLIFPPKEIVTDEDLSATQILLSRATANYSFLSALSVEVKGMKRKLKREKADKEKIDELLEREELLTAYADIAKSVYTASSRMLSIYQLINEEWKLNGKIT